MIRLYSRVIYWIIGSAIALFLLHSAWSSQQENISKSLRANWRFQSSEKEQSSIALMSNHGYLRENATFVSLARNDDLENLLPSIKSIESRFNNKYHYDWIFLNDEEFSDDFKKSVSEIVSGETKFGVIEKKHWSYPEWIDQSKAAEERKKLEEDNVIYGGSESYRHMCRFESGFFFQHKLMQNYKYYWRVDSDVSVLCDIDYDIFKYMRENEKVYGWTITITEWIKTIPTLWQTTREFIQKNPHYLHPEALQSFIRAQENNEEYNLCHFWTNFEVADADFWRGEAYQKYFNHLDQSGGFFYERWGDAPVHSLAVSLFLDQSKIHFFDDIGFSHPPFNHCPAFQKEKGLKCDCLPKDSFDWHDSSCLRTYLKATGDKRPDDYKDGPIY